MQSSQTTPLSSNQGLDHKDHVPMTASYDLRSNIVELRRIATRISAPAYRESLLYQLQALVAENIHAESASRSEGSTASGIGAFLRRVKSRLPGVAQEFTRLRSEEVERVAEIVDRSILCLTTIVAHEKGIDHGSSIGEKLQDDRSTMLGERLREAEDRLVRSDLRIKEYEHQLESQKRENKRERSLLRQQLSHLLQAASSSFHPRNHPVDTFTPRAAVADDKEDAPTHNQKDLKHNTPANADDTSSSATRILRQVVADKYPCKIDSSKTHLNDETPILALSEAIERRLGFNNEESSSLHSMEKRMFRDTIARIRARHAKARADIKRNHARDLKGALAERTEAISKLRKELSCRFAQISREQEAQWVEAVKKLSIDHQISSERAREALRVSEAARGEVEKEVERLREEGETLRRKLETALEERKVKEKALFKAMKIHEEQLTDMRNQANLEIKRILASTRRETATLRKRYDCASREARETHEQALQERMRLVAEANARRAATWEAEKKSLILELENLNPNFSRGRLGRGKDQVRGQNLGKPIPDLVDERGAPVPARPPQPTPRARQSVGSVSRPRAQSFAEALDQYLDEA